MARLIARRCVGLVAVLFGLALIVFVLQAVVPENPARAMVGASAPPEVVAQKSRELGYDNPLPIRFADYLERVLSGNLQTSLRTRNPVVKDLETFAPATLELALAAAAIAAAIGVGLGMLLAAGGRLGGSMRTGADRRRLDPGVPLGAAADPAVLLDASPAARIRARRRHPDGPRRAH